MRILAIGNLGYHERTIAEPIFEELYKLGGRIGRWGGNSAFFLPENYAEQIHYWLTGIPPVEEYERADVIFFLDWWSPIVPLLAYLEFTRRPVRKPWIGIFHGAASIPGDAAADIREAAKYDGYLLNCFDKLVIPDIDLADMMTLLEWADWKKSNQWVACGFPVDTTYNRPLTGHRRRVIFGQRWAPDKAPHRFIEFSEFASEYGIECIATAEPVPGIPSIKFIGWQTQEQLAELYREGGFIWGDADQDLFPYAIVDAMQYGLTPLVRDSVKYQALNVPNQFRFNAKEHAMIIVNSGIFMSKKDWHDWAYQHKNNAAKIAREVYELAQVSE